MRRLVFLKAPYIQKVADSWIEQPVAYAFQMLAKLDQFENGGICSDSPIFSDRFIEVLQVAAPPGMPVPVLALVHGVHPLCRFTGLLLGDAVEGEFHQCPKGEKLVFVSARCGGAAADHAEQGPTNQTQPDNRHCLARSLFSMQSISCPAISRP